MEVNDDTITASQRLVVCEVPCALSLIRPATAIQRQKTLFSGTVIYAILLYTLQVSALTRMTCYVFPANGITMKLIGMMDSPYVRRTAISLDLYGIGFESLPLSVFRDFEAFARLNPAVKAPTLLTDDGLCLMDSTLILQYFETQAAAEKKLLPSLPGALAEDLQRLGIILIAAEKTVQYVYEHRLRPAEKQHQPWVERVTGQLVSACHRWESQITGQALTDTPDQVAVSGTVVWSFIQQMIPQVVAKSEFPRLQAMAEHYEAQPVFLRYPQ